MKKVLLPAVLLVLALGCASGAFANKVRLRAQITPNCGSSSNLKFADIYGDGNIAVMGSYNCRGAFIFDITNPDAPVLANWYNPGSNQQFLEAIVIGNRGYFGSGNGGGVHIVDLTNPYSPVLLGTVGTANGAFSSIHEMMVIDQGGARYLIENFNGFTSKILKVINITNPAAPVFVRDINPTEVSWVHAMHIRGNRMFTSGWGTSSTRARTEIYNISNIGTQAPALLGFIEDPTSVTAGNSMHSSWTSEDGQYLYSARETTNGTGDIRTYDVTDPSQPLLIGRRTMTDLGLNAVTPHNPVVMGNYLYVSWYQAGLQVFDVSGFGGLPNHVAQYDTYPTTFTQTADDLLKLSGMEPWDLVCGSDALQNVLPTTYDGNWAVYPFLGQDKILVGDLRYGLLILDATGLSAPNNNWVADYDGDGKTDVSTYRPSTGTWTVQQSSDNSTSTVDWGGFAGDIPVNGDYDGDGKADRAIFRPTTGTWWFIYSSNGLRPAVSFGLPGDVPVPADWDSDGKTDIAVWRPSNGVWYINQSTLGMRYINWGLSTDKPVVGDYEGDGKPDVAVWRPSNGVWYVIQSSSSIPIYANFGMNGDKPLLADYTGDGRSEFTVYRPSNGVWYWLNPADNSIFAYQFGIAEDEPIPADFDGDGKADISVFRPSQNVWYRFNSSNSTFSIFAFGQDGDMPAPGNIQPQ
jgi:hypothetical protein